MTIYLILINGHPTTYVELSLALGFQRGDYTQMMRTSFTGLEDVWELMVLI